MKRVQELDLDEIGILWEATRAAENLEGLFVSSLVNQPSGCDIR